MARGKKIEKVLTLEEKLEQALVPVGEQPYPVPENWCWTTLNKVAEIITGGTPSKKKPEYYGNFLPFFKPADLDSKRYVFEASEYLSEKGMAVSRIIPAYSTAVCCIGSIGKSGYLIVDGTTNQQINSAIPKFNSLYLYYYINTDTFINQLWEKSSATTISIVNKSKMEQCLFPLAPLAEQQRIVDHVERLFTKLDGAKEKVQAVIDSFEVRRATILHKAFTGELTTKWQKKQYTRAKVWEKKRLSQCCKIGSGGTPSRKHPEYYKGEIPWIKTGEIDWNEVNDSEEYITEQAIANSSAKLYEPGAVMVAMYGMGMTRGRAALLMTYAATNQAVCVLQPDEQLYNRFLYYYFMCNYWSLREKAIGGNQLNLSATIISKFEIPLPDISEQREIVRILESILIKEQQAKETAEDVLEQIEMMKKSILARAFCGGLGTNDPSEDSAVELLRSII